jgi:PAS domain S-box-containing protein
MTDEPFSENEGATRTETTRGTSGHVERFGRFHPVAVRLLRVLDAALPDSVREADSEVRRRGRMLVALLGTLISVSLVLVIGESIAGLLRNVVLGAFVCVASSVILLAFRSGLGLNRAGHLLVGSVYLVAMGFTVGTGGKSEGALICTPLIPMAAILLLGPRGCLQWAVACFVGVFATAVLVESGAPVLFPGYESSWEHVRFPVVAMVIGYATALGLVFEWLRGEALREARDTLIESEVQFRRLAENAGDVVVELDERLRWRYISPSCEEILGWPPESMLDLGFVDKLHPDDMLQLRSQLLELQRVGGTRSVSARLRCADGHWLAAEASIRRCETSEGVPHIVSVIRDVSELRKAELVVRHNERLASTGTLAAGIAHQINNPVGAILASAQYALLCSEDGDRSQLEPALLENVDHARRCGDIVRGLLQFASGQSTLRRSEDLLALLEHARELVATHAKERGVSIELVSPPDPLEVEVNAIEIEQVLVNLIQNGVESKPRSGRVQLCLGRVDGMARLEVSDDGCGIGPDDRAHVFDPFFTTRIQEGGSGLGLSVAHGIVQEHGGRIELHSELGEGTRVVVELPLRAPAVDGRPAVG